MATARLCCVDPRQPKDSVFCWATAGASMPEGLLENFCAMIDNFTRLEIVSHSDCVFTKRELGFGDGPTSPEQTRAVEERSALRRREVARVFLSDGRVRRAIVDGLVFAVGHYDVRTQEINWLDEESAELLAEF